MRRIPGRFFKIQLPKLSRKKLFFGGGLLLVLVIGFFFTWNKFFQAHSKWVPDFGGIYTEATIGTTKNISPLSSNGSPFDHDLQKLIYAGLLHYNPLNGQIEDDLATFRLSEDSKTYFLTLKDGARFSDGSPVTPDDVLFTFEKVIQNPNFGNKSLHDAFEYVSVNIVDEKTITFQLPEPNVYFPSLLTTPILSAKNFSGALLEEINDPDHPGNKRPITSGPFILENIVPNSNGSFRVFLKANPYYYQGRPYLDQIVFYVYPTFDLLEKEHTPPNVFSQLPFRNIEEFQKTLEPNQFSLQEYILPKYTGVFFNLDQKNVANINLRNALSLSIDKKKILEKEIGWNRIDSVFFFEGIENFHEADCREARSILRDYGYKYDEKRNVMMFHQKPVEIHMITSVQPPVYSRFAQAIARAWTQELGIAVKLDVLETDEFQKALQERNYDVVLFGLNFSENFDTLSTWHSSQSGQCDLSNLTSGTVDFLVDEVRISGGESDLFELNRKLSEIIPVIPFATPRYEILVDKTLKGVSPVLGKLRRHADRYFDVQKWYFTEKRAWEWPKGKSKIAGFFQWAFGEK